MAEASGFEPLRDNALPIFKIGAISLSAKLPVTFSSFQIEELLLFYRDDLLAHRNIGGNKYFREHKEFVLL